MPNPNVDDFLGKAQKWRLEMEKLRAILLDCGLDEEWKWHKPCYTYLEGNIVILAGLKEHCWLAFMKGVLLADPHGVLEPPGENSRAGRVIKFTSIAQILEMEPIIKSTVDEAKKIEKAGLKIDFKKDSKLAFSPELIGIFNENPDFKAAFLALTPGRQRGYHLYFSAAKQSSTRTARIKNTMNKIFDGKGLQDR